MSASLTFRIATEEWEFDQIHRLNYETFVEEIPQHAGNEAGALVDKFHEQNTYIVCLEGGDLVGMVALRGSRPFSLDKKLPDLDSHLPPGRTVCEVRLLCVKKAYRRSRVFRELTGRVVRYCKANGYDMAVISGILEQQRLYRHLGFRPFGPVVGTPPALYQPMSLTEEAFERARRGDAAVPDGTKVSFLPGPVDAAADVQQRMGEYTISHRSAEFLRLHRETRRMLCELVGARNVALLLGSGTLANDAVAAQIALKPGRGLVISSGEFGERLIDHARRLSLDFEPLRAEWGHVFEPDELRRAVCDMNGCSWIWAVHCETSTGIVSDLDVLKGIARDVGAQLCMDCISTVGTIPVDLDGVHLASAVSGKGLRSYAGLAIVFYDQLPAGSRGRVPRYLDLGMYEDNDGVPFTLSSNLLGALHSALEGIDMEARERELADLSQWLRSELGAMGLEVMGPAEKMSPGVVTMRVPESQDSKELGEKLEERGYLLSYRSGYLLEKNWIQVCLMGNVRREVIAAMLDDLRGLTRRRGRA